MGTEAAPHLPGSASCILMVMQFLQLCPWKQHTGVQRVPPAGAKEPPDDTATATSPWALLQEKGLVTEGCLCLVQSRAFPPWGAALGAAGLEPALWSGGTASRAGRPRCAQRAELSIALQSTARCFASPTASVGRQDAFDRLPSPISLPLKTNFHHPGVWQEQAM